MTTIQDFLLHHLNIHVTGPSFPHRETPYQCYASLYRDYTPRRQDPPPPPSHPLHGIEPLVSHFTRYNRPLVLGGSGRHIPSDQASGQALVYDKDVSVSWRFESTMQSYEVFFWEKALEAAVGQEVLEVAVEGWVGCESEAGILVEHLSPVEILQKLGDYISALGTQPVTLPIREIVLEMIDSYTTVTRNLEPFSWVKESNNDGSTLIPILEAFVRAQEIFFFPAGRAPVLEITFSVKKWHLDCLDIEFYVSWSPVLTHFEGLNNVVTEGREFCLKPTFTEPNNLPPEQSRDLAVPTTSSFSVAIADESWLQWMR